jgi:IS5 family transposase
MNQISLHQTGFEISPKQTRKRVFLNEMQRVIPWDAFIALISAHAPDGKNGRPPFAVDIMLKVHFMQQ